jgi:hypothetical protein
MSNHDPFAGLGKSAKQGNPRPFCCLCTQPYKGYGHNAQPLMEGRCCDKCNEKVVGERIHRMHLKAGHGHKKDLERWRKADSFVEGAARNVLPKDNERS